MIEYKGTCVVCGIDPGTNVAGLAMLTLDIKSFKILKIKTWAIVPFMTYQRSVYNSVDRQADLVAADKIPMTLKQIDVHMREYDPMAVAIEGPFFNKRRPGAFAPLLAQVLNMVSKLESRYPWLRISIYQPQAIKKTLGVVNNKKGEPKLTTKEKVLKAMLKKKQIMHALEEPIDELTDHEIDAIAIAYKYVHRLQTYEQE